jgi:hypothetical protein
MIDSGEEHFLFVKRYMQFHNIWVVYTDYLTGRYVPSVEFGRREDSTATGETQSTLLFLVYAFFYSLIETDSEGLNAFRIWRRSYPGEEAAISALEAVILPFQADLRTFRNKLDFHGSRSHEKESKGFDVFNNHPGDTIFTAITLFKALNAELLSLNVAYENNSVLRIEQVRLKLDTITEQCRELGRGA